MTGIPSVRLLIAILVATSASLINADVFDIPNDSYFNIFDFEEDNNPEAEAQKLFSLICERYEITHKNDIVDCDNIRFKIKDDHVIIKRDAVDTELEDGSGDGEQPEISPYNKTAEEAKPETQPEGPKPEVPLEHNIEEPSDKKAAKADTPEEYEDKPEVTTAKAGTPDENKDKPEAIAVTAGTPDENKEKTVSDNTTEIQPTSPTPLLEDDDDVGVGVAVIEAAKNQSEPTSVAPTSTDKPQTEQPKLETTATPDTNPPKEEAPGVGDTANKEDDVSKPPTKKVLPTDLAEVEGTPAPKEAEAVDDRQSGVAIVFKQPRVLVPSTVEGSETDKHLGSPSAKLNVQPTETEQPNTGESSKDVTRAGKDTTILVVLFVVVLVIGAAAFTHNFIKKRRAQANQNSDVINGIRRSLQNLASSSPKNNTGDVEQGTEMKPLIKDNNSPVIVKEYTDSKKGIEVEK